ncbi:MAG: FHA domain-containing protein [bacterium]
MPKVIIKKDHLLVKKLSVPEQILAFTVGSEQGNDIIIEDERISYFHLQFEKQGNGYFVRDLQSQWGTYVNGTKIKSRTPIKNNDEIGVGNHSIIFQYSQMNPEPQLMLEDHQLEQSTYTKKLEDRIASVPALTQLNTWLNEEDESVNRKGDFFIDRDAENEPDSFLYFIEDRESNHKDVVDNLVQNEEKSYDDSLLEFENDVLLQSEHPATTKSEVTDEDIPFKANKKKPSPRKEELPTHYLLGIYGPYSGKKFKLKHPETRIGRDRKLNDIVIKKNSKGEIDQSISRRHAKITFRNNKYYVTDKRSKSRTYVNQKKLDVKDVVQIEPGDEIEIVSDRKSHIFRMVRDSDWNFSLPKKAGVWHIRYRKAILNIYSLVFILIAAFLFVNSFKTRNLISQQPKPLKAEEAVWYGHDSDSEFNGFAETDLFYYPAIADLDGDNIIDLVYVDRQGYLKSINGKTRAPLWNNYDFEALPDIPVTLEDLNNNGLPDVLVASKDLRIRAIDGNWGIEIWKSPILAGPLTGSPVVGDFNGDGLKDLAIVSSEDALYIGFLRLENARWVRLDFKEPIYSIVSAADLTGNEIPNILIGTDAGNIIVIDGIRQKILGKININEELNKASGSFVQNNQIRFPVASGDLNGDGTADLVISTMQGNILAINGATLQRLWYDSTTINSQSTTTFTQSISLGDLDGDRLLDVVSLMPNGRIRTYKGIGVGKDRKMLLWESPDTEVGNFVGTPSLADFNKNGTTDVVVADNAGKIYIFEGSTGDILWKNTKAGSKLVSPPLIGDLDDDNHLDILALRSDGNFYKLTTNSLILNGTVVWGQIFGNSKHTNNSFYSERDASIYLTYMGISILIILLVTGLNILFRRKLSELSYGFKM